MRPYYEHAGITIYHADALAALAELETASVDGIVTDPPYCSGGSLEAQKNTSAQGLRSATVQALGFEWFAADNMSTAGLVVLLRACLIAGRRILKPNRAALVFTDWRMVPHLAPALESSGLRYRNMIIWDKGSGGLGTGFKPSYEVVLEFANGATEYAERDGQNVIRNARVFAGLKEHGTQKPVQLIQELIRVAISEGGVVVDPFMGSGTTLLAAKNLSRRAIGVEVSERYCEVAARRLSQEVLDFGDVA